MLWVSHITSVLHAPYHNGSVRPSREVGEPMERWVGLVDRTLFRELSYTEMGILDNADRTKVSGGTTTGGSAVA